VIINLPNNKAYLSDITVTNISQLYSQDGGENQLESIWNEITSLSPMYRHPRLVLSLVSRLSASLSEPTTMTKRQRRHQLCCLCDRFLHHSRRRRDNSSWNLSTCMVLGKRRPKLGSAVRYEVSVRWPDQTE